MLFFIPFFLILLFLSSITLLIVHDVHMKIISQNTSKLKKDYAALIDLIDKQVTDTYKATKTMYAKTADTNLLMQSHHDDDSSHFKDTQKDKLLDVIDTQTKGFNTQNDSLQRNLDTVLKIERESDKYKKELVDQNKQLKRLSSMTSTLDESLKEKIPENTEKREQLTRKVEDTTTTTMDWFMNSYMTPAIKQEYDSLISKLIELDEESNAHMKNGEMHFKMNAIPTSKDEKASLGTSINKINKEIDTARGSSNEFNSNLEEKRSQIEAASNAWAASNQVLMDEKNRVRSDIEGLSNNESIKELYELSQQNQSLSNDIVDMTGRIEEIRKSNDILDDERKTLETKLKNNTCSI